MFMLTKNHVAAMEAKDAEIGLSRAELSQTTRVCMAEFERGNRLAGKLEAVTRAAR